MIKVMDCETSASSLSCKCIFSIGATSLQAETFRIREAILSVSQQHQVSALTHESDFPSRLSHPSKTWLHALLCGVAASSWNTDFPHDRASDAVPYGCPTHLLPYAGSPASQPWPTSVLRFCTSQASHYLYSMTVMEFFPAAPWCLTAAFSADSMSIAHN